VTTAEQTTEHGRDLESREKRGLALLGLPTFGLALSITVVSTYVPTVARQFTGSTTVIGVLVGGEGLAALFLPVLAGSWSDRLRTPIGGRLPFIIAGVPVAAAALVAMGLVRSLGAMAIAVGVFFIGYFIAYEPYRALYPDLVPDEVAGQAQSTQAVWRGAGTGVALLGGGLLLSIGTELPFVAGAIIVASSCAAFVLLSVRRGIEQRDPSGDTVRETLSKLREMLVHERPLRAFFFANALWELALAALKTFVILWLTRGLGVTLAEAALVVGATALFILGGAAISGKLADKFGRRRIMLIAMLVFGFGLIIPTVTTFKPVLVAAVPFISFGGGVLLSLPYALLQPLMPERHHGALTGYYSASRGIGVMLGPLLAGAAISAFKTTFSSTQGYSATWAVCSAAILLSVPLLLRMGDEADKADQSE